MLLNTFFVCSTVIMLKGLEPKKKYIYSVVYTICGLMITTKYCYYNDLTSADSICLPKYLVQILCTATEKSKLQITEAVMITK